MDWVFLGVAVLLLGLNAFFVGAEFALISARRSSIEPLAQQGDRRAQVTLGAMENVSLMMATAQLGITVCSLGLGAVGEPALAHLISGPMGAVGLPDGLIHPVAFVLALAIVVGLHVVAGEMIPKNIALAGPDRSALWLGPPLVLVSRVLKPFVVAMNWLANRVLHLIGVEPRDEVVSTFTRDEVHEMVEESSREGLLDEHERDLLSRALHFEEGSVQEVTIPVSEVVLAPRTAPRSKLETLSRESGFSRIALYDPDVQDQFVGYVHVKDVLDNNPRMQSEPVPDSAVRRLPSLASEATLRDALETMRRSQAHMLQVRDGGRTVGIIVLEDVIARIVGQIGAQG
ncbi:CBS domain containing-hemolysin-like protein [Barrientosiimonas humi]|uniref:CBS domain containing-hemolysin-like protein n=1 Tax=Barrientosiimonas humi TaxID=999931 RepID=A0A542X7V3_9MICO|nr:hemolysin family protein [Barrientosiimonas humi]TQL31918.1 CBS domain containing-hemolysin-like protein [Barrientosiimonas humi]CAG7571723.1 Hemolysin C [Barrientosiimonas humi]